MNDILLLDTDVASFLFKGSPRADAYGPLLEDKRLALSFMSVAECYRWTLKRSWGHEKVEQLRSVLQRYIVVPYDNDLAWAWARVTSDCERVGCSIASSDAWIAAIAIRHGIPLVTNNTRHFEAAATHCGLVLVMPDTTDSV